MLYEVNEKVLCFHGPLIYQAKILKAEKWTGEENATGATGPHYFVHYQGWKQTWDEWVSETRLLKFNDENLAKQKALVDARKASIAAAKEAASAQAAASRPRKSGSGGEGAGGGGRGAGGSGSAADGRADSTGRADSEEVGTSSRRKEARGTKRGRDTVEQEDEYVKRPEIKIVIPDALKVQLVDDWENVTRLSQLVPLPRRPNVQQILDEYREHYVRQNSGKKGFKGRPPAVLDEILTGLRVYFDKALGHNLLYRFERAQLVEVRKSWTRGELDVDGEGVDAGGESKASGAADSTGSGAGAAGASGGSGSGDHAKSPSNGHAQSEPASVASAAAITTKSTRSEGGGGSGGGGAGGAASAGTASASTNGAGGAADEAGAAARPRRSTGRRESATDAAEASKGDHDELQPSKVYGAEHLLRLFVNLPSIIAHTTLDVESVNVLREHLAEFLNYMVKERGRLFVKSYQDASPAYHRITQI